MDFGKEMEARAQRSKSSGPVLCQEGNGIAWTSFVQRPGSATFVPVKLDRPVDYRGETQLNNPSTKESPGK
jgi:hypothetical protein